MAGNATGAPPSDFGRQRLRFGFEREPEKIVRAEREKIRRVRDDRKFRPAKQLDGHEGFERRQIQFHRLGEAREVGDHEDGFLFVAQDVAQNLVVVRLEKFAFALAERAPAFAQREHPAHPPEQRMRIGQLRPPRCTAS